MRHALLIAGLIAVTTEYRRRRNFRGRRREAQPYRDGSRNDSRGAGAGFSTAPRMDSDVLMVATSCSIAIDSATHRMPGSFAGARFARIVDALLGPHNHDTGAETI
jgi:hypothetical protein